jgi:hypothetical protein
MNKLIVIGFSLVLVIIATLLFWQHQKHPSDTQIQHRAFGTWSNTADGGKFVFSPDVSWLIQTPSHVTNRINSWSGTWRVEDGFIVEAMTNIDIGRYALTYKVPSLKILQIDKEKMVYQPQGDKRVFTLLKPSP